MKKIVIGFLLFLIVFPFFSVTNEKEEVEENRGIFISYIELSRLLKGKSEDVGKENVTSAISNVEDLGFNTILLQVRSFSDAIYESQLFPWSSVVSEVEGEAYSFDVLSYFLKECHKKKIKLYAWINPFRIRGDLDISDISSKNPAYSYLGSSNVYSSTGIYYNPASKKVQNLIIKGVEELVKNYEVDGVLFDDYFYPTTNTDIDSSEYSTYLKQNPSASLEVFRLTQISKLIKRVHSVCQKYDVLFAVSPDGNIDNNYQKHYADVRLWGSGKEYVDVLMPQIYYGFYNGAKDFYSTLGEWEEITKKVVLMPVLAFYKVGTVDNFAKEGKEEWVNSSDIIMREILLSRNAKCYEGFSLFRYDYLFQDELFTHSTMAEVKNMKKVLK